MQPMHASFPDSLSAPKPTYLLVPQIFNGCGIVHLGYALEITGQKPPKQSNRTYNIWPADKAYDTFRKHENGMVATNIICSTVLNQASPNTLSRASTSMVDKL